MTNRLRHLSQKSALTLFAVATLSLTAHDNRATVAKTTISGQSFQLASATKADADPAVVHHYVVHHYPA